VLEDTQTGFVKLPVAKHVTIPGTILQGLRHVSLHKGTEMKALQQTSSASNSRGKMGHHEHQLYH
jgi:hypothetical protein